MAKKVAVIYEENYFHDVKIHSLDLKIYFLDVIIYFHVANKVIPICFCTFAKAFHNEYSFKSISFSMAKYIKKEIADLNGKGSTQAYYRMKTNGKLGFNEFLEHCHSQHGAFSESTLLGAITAFRDQLVSELSKGYTVKIDGLGTFGTKLGVRKDKELDTFEEGTEKRNAVSLRVKGVSFRVDKELVNDIDLNCSLVRGGEERLRKSEFTLEKRIERARTYLQEHGFMHVSDYASINGLSYSTASRELRSIAADPTTGIVSRGRKSAKLYLLR